MFRNTRPTWQRFSPLAAIVPLREDFEYVEMTVNIVPDWNVSMYIEWEPPVKPEGVLGDPVYTVYYSESEEGPYLQLTKTPITDMQFFIKWQIQDSKVFEQHIVIQSEFPDGTVLRSRPRHPSIQLPKWHILRQKDIFRREKILLQKFVGVESIIWNPKYTGKRCPECWDTTHLKITNDHCEVCYGKGFEGGYDTGMRTMMQYSSIDLQSRVSYQGRVEPNTLSAWTVAYPMIHPDAIVLRTGDRRVFSVDSHQGSTEMRTNLQRQTVILKELGRDSIENKLFGNTNYIDVMPVVPHIHT